MSRTQGQTGAQVNYHKPLDSDWKSEQSLTSNHPEPSHILHILNILILRLSWIKDGRKIAEDEDGIIVTTEGHLIIVSARLTDSGNFTCVAENLAGSRRSPPAEIVIYGGCQI